jgi:PAS domain S-box-containing protein
MQSEDIYFYKRLCEQASIGVIILDTDFRITMINPSAAELFDVDALEIQNQPVDRLVAEHRGGVTRKLLERAVSQARPLEYRIRRGSGKKRRYLAIMVDPIRSDGGVEGVCFWVRDLTRRMEFEKRLAEIEKLASLGQLAGGLAHHFNNILGGIVTAVDHALTMDDPITSHRTLVMIQNGLVKAVELTRRLLDFSTPDLLDRNMADLTEVVINFVEDVEPSLIETGRQIELEIKGAPILPIHPKKLRQVLDALLANSVQAIGPRGGQIKLTLGMEDGEIYLEFQDNGPGIPPPLVDRIFDPFFTTRGALGGGSEGNLGLGLAVARRLAEEIGGTLSYDSERSKSGTCFTLTFAAPPSEMEEK